jgi:protein gp37
MGTNSKIEWCDHTFNPWRGCTKKSEGCKHCYAEVMSKRNPSVLGIWGRHGARVIAAESYWRLPLMWNKAAKAAGERRRVFCASLADIFEGEDTMPPASWPLVQQARGRLWALIEATPHLDWLLLTKRPENALSLATAWTGGAWPDNVWALTSVENQKAAEERIPHLRRIPARVRGLSLEPLLGPVDLSRLLVATPCWHCGNVDGEARRCYCGVTIPSEIHWVIAGGESGPQARPMHPDWARGIRDQAQAAGVPYFFKQWGEWLPIDHLSDEEHEALYCPIDEESPIDRRRCRVQTRAVQWHDGKDGYYSIAPGRIGYMVFRVGKHAAGRLLDGREWDEVPEPALTVASGS